MKSRIFIALLILAAAGFFTLGRVTAENRAKLHAKTAVNLSTAMHGEAFAYAKYLLFAEQARKNGSTELADLFENTAKVERLEHMREEAEVAGVVGSDEENLKDAIKGESYEVETMYREFADEARKVGDKLAADRFEEIRKDEMGHRDAFKAALTRLQTRVVSSR